MSAGARAHAHAHVARPVGGKVLDRPMVFLLGVFAVAEAFIAYRFAAGIGAISNMNDGYAWGIWEPINVVVFTGIGAGAYSVGLLCYLLNRGHYHPLVRPAVLLGAIAYSLGGASIVIALGRPWNMYWLAIPGMWNLSSVLLEVAICVIAYVSVLWIEMLPAVFESAAASGSPARSSWARRWGARLALAMPYIIALAMLLPTMHQSSLGGLMLVAGPKLHPIWQTPHLPLLALISCMSMGLGAVAVLVACLGRAWNAKRDHGLLVEMSKVNGGLLLLFAALRIGDVAYAGELHLLGHADRYTLFFVIEMALTLIPAVLFFTPAVENGKARFVGAMMAVAAGSLFRVDAFLICYNAGEAWHYWPSVGEIAVTVGMIAVGSAVFIAMSRLLPVVVVADRPANDPVAPAEAPLTQARVAALTRPESPSAAFRRPRR